MRRCPESSIEGPLSTVEGGPFFMVRPGNLLSALFRYIK